MNTQLWTALGAMLCLSTLSHTSLAETRTEWGSGTISNATPMDDTDLMQVSARGIDEHAIKALQHNGKLAEYAAANGGGAAQALLAGGNMAESADKQAAQAQYKMAMAASQTMANTMQITGVVTSMTAPVTFVPVMTMPMFGLPLLPPKASSDK